MNSGAPLIINNLLETRMQNKEKEVDIGHYINNLTIEVYIREQCEGAPEGGCHHLTHRVYTTTPTATGPQTQRNTVACASCFVRTGTSRRPEEQRDHQAGENNDLIDNTYTELPPSACMKKGNLFIICWVLLGGES